jgi:signal transduction histidine kinase
MLLDKFLPLFAFFFQSFLLYTVIGVRRKQAVHYALSIFLGAMALWGLLIFWMRSSPTLEDALTWERLVLPIFAVISYSFFFFVVLFTGRSLSRRVWVGVCLVGLFFLSIAPIPWVLQGMQLRPYGYAPIIGPLWFLWIAGVYAPALVSFYYLFRFFRTTASADMRNRAIYVLSGVAFSFLGATSDYVAAMGLLPHPGGIYGNILFAALVTVAVVRHQLVDARIYLRRGVAYGLLSLTVILPYVALAVILSHQFQVRLPLAVNILFILILAVSFRVLGGHFQAVVDRWFYRSRYDALQALHRFSQTASHTLELEELSTTLIQVVRQAMAVDTVHLLLYSSERGMLSLSYSSKMNPDSFPPFPERSLLVGWLKGGEGVFYRQDLEMAPILRGLPESSWGAIDRLEGQLFITLKSGGRLVGVLVLGPRPSQEPYTQEDVGMLVTVANQAAIAIENAKVMDSLEKERLRAFQLLSRTVLAQEDERKRISIELHDSVAQWLVGASYRIQHSQRLLEESGNHQAVRELTEIEGTVDQILKELRRVMAGLHPPALDELGLVHALRQAVEKLKNDGIACRVETKGTPVRLPLSIEIAVYRLVQEALTNVRKHSQATKVILRLNFRANDISIEIRDNGKGFDLPTTVSSLVLEEHMGLFGMKERASMLGGELKIETRPGAGTCVKLSCPVPEPPMGSSEDQEAEKDEREHSHTPG